MRLLRARAGAWWETPCKMTINSNTVEKYVYVYLRPGTYLRPATMMQVVGSSSSSSSSPLSRARTSTWCVRQQATRRRVNY